MQALGDGRLAVWAANTRGRGEELLYTGHLSRYSSQLVENRRASGKMLPVGDVKIGQCSDWFCVFKLSDYVLPCEEHSVRGPLCHTVQLHLQVLTLLQHCINVLV